VIRVESGFLEGFVRSLGDEFYVSGEAAREAVSSRSMFNVIHLETGFKEKNSIDLTSENGPGSLVSKSF